MSDPVRLYRSARCLVGYVRPRRWLPRRTAYFRVTARSGRQFLLQSTPWFGIWAAGVWAKGSFASWPETSFPKPEANVKKKAAAASPEDKRQHMAGLESNLFSKLFPLIEHMAVTRYDDGDPRKPGWITIQTSGAAWVVNVKDPDSSSSFKAVANSLDDALALASLLLEQDGTPWEHDRFLADMQKPKKK